MDQEPGKANVTYTAPIGSIDMAAEMDDGTPYEIWPCTDCRPWHAAVIRDDHHVFVREWHSVDCTQFQSLLAQDDHRISDLNQ